MVIGILGIVQDLRYILQLENTKGVGGEETMTDTKSLVIEKEGGVLNVVMQFHVAKYRSGVALVGLDSFRNPKTNERYRTYSGAIGSVQIYSDYCTWTRPHSGEQTLRGDFRSFDEVNKFAINKFIQIVRSHLKTEYRHTQKLTREEAKQIRAHLRDGIKELMKSDN